MTGPTKLCERAAWLRVKSGSPKPTSSRVVDQVLARFLLSPLQFQEIGRGRAGMPQATLGTCCRMQIDLQ